MCAATAPADLGGAGGARPAKHRLLLLSEAELLAQCKLLRHDGLLPSRQAGLLGTPHEQIGTHLLVHDRLRLPHLVVDHWRESRHLLINLLFLLVGPLDHILLLLGL